MVRHPHINTTEEVWGCEAPVKALSMEKLGHAWPSTLGLDVVGFPNEVATFNFTTAHLLPFFEDNPLPEKYLD